MTENTKFTEGKSKANIAIKLIEDACNKNMGTNIDKHALTGNQKGDNKTVVTHIAHSAHETGKTLKTDVKHDKEENRTEVLVGENVRVDRNARNSGNDFLEGKNVRMDRNARNDETDILVGENVRVDENARNGGTSGVRMRKHVHNKAGDNMADITDHGDTLKTSKRVSWMGSYTVIYIIFYNKNKKSIQNVFYILMFGKTWMAFFCHYCFACIFYSV